MAGSSVADALALKRLGLNPVDDDEEEEEEEEDEFEPLFNYSQSVGPAPTWLSDDDDEDEVIITAAPRRKPETVPAKGPTTPTPQKASTTSVVLDDDDDSWLLCSTPPKLPTMPQPTANLALLQLRQKRRELMMLQEASSPGALKRVEEQARMQAQQRVQAESSPSVVRALKPQVEPSSDAPTSEEMEKVLIKVQNKSGNCQSIRIFSNDKFEKLFTVYANMVQASLPSLSFRFDGDQLSPSTTPKELDMEDGDVIEVGSWINETGTELRDGVSFDKMDSTPDEIGFVGVLGILNEAVKLVRSYSRHFLYMAGTLVLPLGILLFSHNLATGPLLHKLARMGHHQQLDAEFVGLYLLAVLYIILVLALSLFATAAIVYSVACIYTGKGLSYMKVISVVPKVWSRLMNTFLWAHILVSFYYAGFVMLVLALPFIQETSGVNVTLLMIPSAIVFNVFLVHFNLVWHLASVVCVLEDTKGVSAVKRSNTLIQGKRLAGFYLFCIYAACMVGLLALFGAGLAKHSWLGRVSLAGLLLVLWTAVTLLAIVIQSIFYFVCKSYHQEIIDRSALAEKLDGYLGDYMLLRGPVSLGALDSELEDI